MYTITRFCPKKLTFLIALAALLLPLAVSVLACASADANSAPACSGTIERSDINEEVDLPEEATSFNIQSFNQSCNQIKTVLGLTEEKRKEEGWTWTKSGDKVTFSHKTKDSPVADGGFSLTAHRPTVFETRSKPLD